MNAEGFRSFKGLIGFPSGGLKKMSVFNHGYIITRLRWAISNEMEISW